MGLVGDCKGIAIVYVVETAHGVTTSLRLNTGHGEALHLSCRSNKVAYLSSKSRHGCRDGTLLIMHTRAGKNGISHIEVLARAVEASGHEF
jgi:hypothetical protein